ncbi:MAG: HD domain-containing protein, partial [Bacteroidia bacterium]|nr:HD domain-containing protein [Bacteroidia bacterium]
TLRQKGVEISDKEAEALYCAILLHDLGHGPFSHSLEHTLIHHVAHENGSLMMMQLINQEMGGQLDLCIEIFTNQYPKKFLHSLISGQLDMDRLDYLGRDSFYTGVSEGIVGADRIINMLDVHDDELVVEEKGIYSIEKFIIARRLMYWQVYLHKTVVAADLLLTNIMRRASELALNGTKLPATNSLSFFLENKINNKQFKEDPEVMKHFIQIDDSDVLSAIKSWQFVDDKVLALLSRHLVNRNLPKILVSTKQFTEQDLNEKEKHVAGMFKLAPSDIKYFASMAMIKNDAYKVEKSTSIKIRMKSGEVMDVTDASDNYNLKSLNQTVKKYYLSFYR